MGGAGPWVPPLGICTAAWDPAVSLRQAWGTDMALSGGAVALRHGRRGGQRQLSNHRWHRTGE